MKGFYYIIMLILLLISCNSDGNGDNIKPSLSNITESVYVSASVVPKDTYYSRASKSGIIRNIYVEEGDMVTKGQALFKISPSTDVNNRLINAEISLQEAELNSTGEYNLLKNIDFELRTLKEQHVIDSMNYKRRQCLWNQKIGSKNALEKSLLSPLQKVVKIDMGLNL
jgi:HlyD family secretion protein